MVNLGDYVGQLLSEISMARMQADLETIRLAELYAMHPLLRTLPVPHMRLPRVDLDLPVVIEESEEPRAGESTRGGAALADLVRSFDQLLDRRLEDADVVIPENDRRRLRALLNERATRREVPDETSVGVFPLADDLTSTAVRFIEEIRIRPPKLPSDFAAELGTAARVEFLKLRSLPPRLSVLVTTSEVREAGDAESLARLRLRVSEEGLEWTTIQSDDGQPDRLVPE
jgi:hypothetical protein